MDQFWVNIEDVIIKTLIAAQPQLQRVYRSCFPATHNDGVPCRTVYPKPPSCPRR